MKLKVPEAVGVPLSSVHEKPAAAATAATEETFHELQYSHVWQPAALAAAPRDVQTLLLFEVRQEAIRRVPEPR